MPHTGDRFGPYEIVEKIGAGGMGEVYRARDTRLGRVVALKISQQRFSDRFEREARAVAALNHPNVCALYDVGPDYLVMEFIDGESPKGPLPLDQALRIARQIADALDAAHEKGIVHRDLKPANLKITLDGTVKVLDFGLAKTEDAASGDPESSPTMTISPTRAGMILGTAAYMSPEQARGKVVDKRADIWAFGVVLYELLTGRRPFHGDDLTEMLASVMKDPPDLSTVPLQACALIESCLEKDPRRRLRDIGDAWRLVDVPAVPSRRAGLSRMWPWVVAAIFGAAGVLGWLRGSTIAPAEVSFIVPPPSGTELSQVGGPDVDRISPDGSTILFYAAGGVYLRKLNSLETVLLARVQPFSGVFWSPDSQSIAYDTVDRQLVKMRVPKGAPERITDLEPIQVAGGSWGEKGTILYAQEGLGLYLVSSAGGKSQLLEVQGLKKGRYYFPEFLQGGEDFVFDFVPEGSETAQVYLAKLIGAKVVNPKLLLTSDTAASFTPAGGGSVLFVRNDNLFSQKLDVKAGKLLGDPELVQERVASIAGWRTANFSASRNGTLVWRTGTAVVSQVTVFDRKGNRLATAGSPAPVTSIRVSPDGSRLMTSGLSGCWVIDANGPGRVSLNWAPGHAPVWSPDGLELISVDGTKLVGHSANGSGDVREIAKIPIEHSTYITGISSDGRRILLLDGAGYTIFSLDGRTLQQVVPQSSQSTAGGELSPDGKWVVYRGSFGGPLYVKAVSGAGLPKQIASRGVDAVWRADGKEILYMDLSQDSRAIASMRVEGSGGSARFTAPGKRVRVNWFPR